VFKLDEKFVCAFDRWEERVKRFYPNEIKAIHQQMKELHWIEE